LAQYDINLREYWRILKKRKLVVALTAIILGIFSTAFAVFKAPAPIYTAVCSIKFERETTVEGLYTKTLTWSSGDDIETQVSIITSYSVFEKVAERLGLVPRAAIPADSRIKGNVIRVIDELQSKVEVSRQEFTNLLHIKVQDGNPVFAQKLANSLAQTYKELHSQNQMKRTTEAIKYIENQLVSARKKLRSAEEEFNWFSQDNQLLSIDLQSENLLARNQEIQDKIRELQEAKIDLQALIGRLDKFVGGPLGSGQSFYSTKADNHYQSVNNFLVELQLKRDTLLEDFTTQHPEVVAINRKILENARKMKLLLQMQMREIEKRERDSESELAELDRKTNALMEKKLEYDRLKRKVDLYHDMTALLERKHQEALIKKAEKPEEITIVKPALLPTQPVNPPKTATTGIMGIVIGLVLGMVFAFIVETFDTSLGAIEDVEHTLNTPVLGVIAQAEGKEVQESLKGKLPEGIKDVSSLQAVNLISHFAPKSMVSESFRALRTNIQFKDAENNVKAIAVTSASPQEGKTFVSINMAVTMAQAGVRTLLIGSDMRKPMIDRAFGIDMTPGLSDILLGNLPWRETVKTISDIIVGKMSLDEITFTPGLDNLHIITSGTMPPNPAELVESKRLREFIEEAKEDYDLIIFDSPPILSTADAAILSSKVDGVLLVYRVGTVSRGLLKRATSQLDQVKCNILGVILNGLKPEISPDFQDFKYYKHYYSYGHRETESKGEKKGFSLFGAKKIGISGGELRMPLGSEKRKNRSKRVSASGSVLIVAALALLAAGLLWQNGVLDPSKLFGSGEKADKDLGKPVIKRKLQTQTNRKADAGPRVQAAMPQKVHETKHNSKSPGSFADHGSVKSIAPSEVPIVAKERASASGRKSEAEPAVVEPQTSRIATSQRIARAKEGVREEKKAPPAGAPAPASQPSIDVVANAIGSYLAGERLSTTKADSATGTAAPEQMENREDRSMPPDLTALPAEVKPPLAVPQTGRIATPQATGQTKKQGERKETKVQVAEAPSPSSPPKEQVVADAVRSFLTMGDLGPAKATAAVDAAVTQPQNVTGKPKVPPATKAPTPSGLVHYPYSLYLGSFQSLARAKKAIATYSEKGFSPYWVRVDFKNKGLWFRVFHGHFRNREDAKKFARQRGLEETDVKKTEYANLIGTYAQGPELREEMRKLSALGFSPYVVTQPDGTSRLLVGAYITEAGAESQHDILMSSGIRGQVVKR